MTDSQRYRIISNDYADLIINNEEYQRLFSLLPNAVKNEINDYFSILHVPVENMTPDSFSRFGYHTIPICYGLLSTKEVTYLQTTPEQPFHLSDYQGKDVIIGLVDTGVDYRNEVFLNPDKSTRILSIWDQSIDSNDYPKGFFYGTEYNEKQINAALKSPDPLSVVPSTDTIGHGTMLAGIAAGTPIPEYNFTGTAPLSNLVIVKLKEAKEYLREFFVIPIDSHCYQENDIIMGIKYLDQVATNLNKPLVIVFALGTNKGDHGGRGILSRYVAAIGDKIGRSVTIAAGNEGNRGLHYFNDIPAEQPNDTVSLSVSENDPGFSLEFWGVSPNYLWVDLYSPDGTFLTHVPPIHHNNIIVDYGSTSIVVDVILDVPYSNEQFIVLRFRNPLPGTWKFVVYGFSGDIPRQFHFWLPLHNFVHPGTQFVSPDIYTTITDPANNTNLICTTAYNPKTGMLYEYASRGFTVLNAPRPDIAAPGVNLICPYPDNQFVISSSSSLAAAYTAGIAANILQWGIIDGNLPFLTNVIIQRTFMLGAYRNPDSHYPNPDWGFGILNTNTIYDALEQYITSS